MGKKFQVLLPVHLFITCSLLRLQPCFSSILIILMVWNMWACVWAVKQLRSENGLFSFPLLLSTPLLSFSVKTTAVRAHKHAIRDHDECSSNIISYYSNKI